MNTYVSTHRVETIDIRDSVITRDDGSTLALRKIRCEGDGGLYEITVHAAEGSALEREILALFAAEQAEQVAA